jgi:hypothetical protein
VWSTTTPWEAELLREYLEHHGVPAFVDNEASALYVIGMATSAVPFVISVPESSARHAGSLLEEFLRRRRDPSYPRPPTPTDVPESALIRVECACGKGLEFLRGSEGMEIECPWCARKVVV